MVSRAGAPGGHAVLRGLCDARRRRVLRLLRDRTSSVDLDELATLLAADERGVAPGDVTRDEVRAATADLVHNHLPRLEGTGLIAWNRADGAVATTDHPALSDPTLDRILDDPDDDWDPILENLADDRRRCVLAVLRDHGGVLNRCELAKRVVERERERRADDGGPASDGGHADDGSRADDGGPANDGGHATHANDAVLSLHHVHVPKLERAGLLAYHADEGTVSYQADSTVADDLLEETAGDASHPLVSSSA